ncbi:MAG: DUF4960 domain-containing protein [Paludibacter sp.]|nr:DUF4960 domain-containing protein [Paludibacter sp.]
MKKLNIVLMFIFFALVSCEDVKYEEKAIALPALTNVKAVNDNNNIRVAWDAPVGVDSFSVVLNIDGVISILENNPKADTIVNPLTNVEHVVTAKFKTKDGRMSEGVTSRITIPGTAPIENLAGKRTGNDIVLTWKLPTVNDATNIEIAYDDKVVTLASTDTTYRIVNTNTERKYEIKVRTKTATIASHYVTTVVSNVKFAFVTTYESLDALIANGDDDEIAAANWFVFTYPTGTILPVSKIKDFSVDLTQFSVIWVHIDRVGTGALPSVLKDAKVIANLKNYYKTGGSLLLSTHATQLVSSLGRTTRKPGIIGAGSGGVGTDTWTTNPNIGGIYNHMSDPIFANMSSSPEYFPAVGSTIPLIGPGNREDHNCMWDLNSYGYSIPNDGPNVVKAFETENTATVLSTWGQVTDFCCGGIIYFSPTPTYKGKCVAIGLAAYEWNQNSGINLYQSNIELLTKNSFEILK